MDGSDTKGAQGVTAGGAIFARLKALGVSHVFVNSGTDFPPIIEGLARAAAAGEDLPVAVTCPHEHAALGMAMGMHYATGGLQAVMLHTNVGLANGAAGAINAAMDRTPMVLMSGRTPTTEQGRFGARTVPIGWGQEMRDQHALVREISKWDYELRIPEMIGEMLDRAAAISLSEPQGPTYLSLPREVLCEEVPQLDLSAPPSMTATRAGPDPAGFARLAELIAAAERPVIVAQRGCGTEEGFAALARIAEGWGLPVCRWWCNALPLADSHPMNVGGDPAPWLAEADLVLVLDALAPWGPDMHPLSPAAVVVQMGPDPLYARQPVRNFAAHLALSCKTEDGLAALEDALSAHAPGDAATARRERIGKETAARRAAIRAEAEAGAGAEDGPRMTKAHVALRLGEALEGRRATVLSELGVPLDPLALEAHGSWRQEPHSGGLGWAFPAGLGMKLADPGRTVVATMGDGSYLFANPAACHQIAEALGIALVIVVVNNEEWGAVRQSVAGMYPGGAAASANTMPLTSLSPVPDLVKIAEASRAHAERVDRAEDLPAALSRALEAAEAGRCALVEAMVRP
ncbi:thiamine pyrophosphate-requiring protein [Rhodovulum sp. DZ06]|uniref:thiamine pyrophosphate-requiring protein n=1 Tax=Rhodovulum sp. DZ06 TaxID=3425126 RepID=UPI003D32A3CB